MRELLEAEEREKQRKRLQEEKDQAKRDKRKQKAQRAKVGAPPPPPPAVQDSRQHMLMVRLDGRPACTQKARKRYTLGAGVSNQVYTMRLLQRWVPCLCRKQRKPRPRGRQVPPPRRPKNQRRQNQCLKKLVS